MRCSVYIATSPSGKQYVGKTKNKLSKRIARHRYDAKSGSEGAFHRAIRKYGNHIEFEEFFVAFTEEMAFEIEKRLIRELSTFRPAGYNCTLGGEGVSGLIRSPETLLKMANASRGRIKTKEECESISKRMLGHPVSHITRQKIGEANKGKIKSPALIEQMSLSRLGVKRGPHSKETKQKMSDAHKRAVMCIETKEWFPSVGEAAVKHNTAESMIVASCGRRPSYTANGYHWMYADHGDVEVRLPPPNKRNKAVKCVETGIVYVSAAQAGRALNIDPILICKCRLGIIEYVGGFHWVYA